MVMKCIAVFLEAKNLLVFLFAMLLLLLSSCVFNINHDPECIECYYKIDGKRVTEGYCDPNISQADKDAVRDRMRVVTDSLNVSLNCTES